MDTEKTSGVGAENAAEPSPTPQTETPSHFKRKVAVKKPADRRRLDGAFVASIFARIAVTAVFIANVMCAVQFIVAPAGSAAAYGLSTDYATQALVAGLGVAFLMWNCTYPAVVFDPVRFRQIFVVVLVQQVVGLVGESAIRVRLVAEGMHDSLMVAGVDQFILWDAGGLLAMGVTFVALTVALRRRRRDG